MHHGAQSAPYDIFNFTIEMEMELQAAGALGDFCAWNKFWKIGMFRR